MNNLTNWLSTLSQDSNPTFEECKTHLAQHLPLLNEFVLTEQDDIWHAEGNVAIHTDMVLTELYKVLKNEASHITGERRQALVLGTLLHDIAKPLTTRRKVLNEKERVVAPRHEEQGRSYLALRLCELPLSHTCIDSVLGLVGYHHLPKLLVIKNQDKSEYLRLAGNADTELLYWLEVADMRGRICPDLEAQLTYLQEYRMFCEEYGIWGSADIYGLISPAIQVKQCSVSQTYLNNLAVDQILRREITIPEEAIAKTYAHAEHHSNFVIMCGISGSGKSHWIKNNLADFTLISLDEIREEINGSRDDQKSRGQVLHIAKDRLKVCLAKKQNVAWDATNLRKDFRDTLCTLGRNYHALITLVAFQQPITSIRKGNANRQHAIPEDILDKQISNFQWPEFGEAHRMIVVGEKGKVLSYQGSFNFEGNEMQLQ